MELRAESAGDAPAAFELHEDAEAVGHLDRGALTGLGVRALADEGGAVSEN